MKSYQYLEDLFKRSFSAKTMKNCSFGSFKKYILSQTGKIDPFIEGFIDFDEQRDFSIKYRWGHNHDFGNGYFLDGQMKNRHLSIIADFIDKFDFPEKLGGMRVLDIGAWTGGISLLLAAMGAKVVALEEVVKYSNTVNYLAYVFGIEKQLCCIPKSLYEFLPRYFEEFDIVIYSGVIYHVTDPLLSMRLIFTSLRDGGSVYLETYGIDSNETVCKYEGPGVFHHGEKNKLNREGWNYFIPSSSCLGSWCQDVGFDDLEIGECVDSHIKGVARRKSFSDFCRAGLSTSNCL